MPPILKHLPLLCLLAAVAARASTDPNASVREEFRQAYTASQTVASSTDSAALQDYVLYPYLQAARLRAALVSNGPADTTDAAIEAFVTAYAAEPVVRELRRAWLLSLATRNKWPLFTKYYRADVADIELRCQALNAQLALQPDNDVSNSLLILWMSPATLPVACDAAVALAQTRNAITPELLQQRATLALKAGNSALARELLKSLSPAVAEPLLQWAALIEQPQTAIDGLLADPGAVLSNDALLDGWLRLARKDPDAALTRYERLLSSRQLDAEAASPYAMALALSLSWSRRPEALSYFERVRPDDFDDIAWEWYARAAIWAGNWPLSNRVLATMPDALKTQARWRYWAARIAGQLNDQAAAVAGYAQLVATEDNYYAVMAAARLRKSYKPHEQVMPVARELVKNLATRPAMQRAHELLLVDLKSQAGSEWNLAYDTLPPAEQYAAIHLASDWGWHDVAIATATQQRLFNDYALLYPRPFEQEVKVAAKLAKLSTELVYAQLRQESLYRADALSVANARGLLQLLPDTARSTAIRWKRAVPTPADLFLPAVNVPLGAARLRDLIDRYDGQVVVALAAYNAGPNAAGRWLPAMPLDSDIWIENIPYNETRNYVQKVLWHSRVFHWLENRRALDTRSWLAKVAPGG